MPKVTLITGSLPPIACGVGYYTRILLGELHKANEDIGVVTSRAADPESVPYPVKRVPDWKIRRLNSIARQINSNGSSIVHIQYPAVGYERYAGINLLPLYLRLRQRSLRIVVTLHEYHASRFIGRLRNLLTIVFAHSIIVSNQADIAALPRLLRGKVQLIPIGSNIKPVPKDHQYFVRLLRNHGLDTSKTTLGFFGFAYPGKRLEILIEALGDERLVDFQLLLLTGLGEQNAYHRSLVQQIEAINSSGRRIAWTGFLDDAAVSRALQELPYIVLPFREPLTARNGTAIAAMSHGCVLVSTAASPAKLSEPFVHEKNCYLLPDMDTGSLVAAITQLDKDAHLRHHIQEAALVTRDYFSWEHIALLHHKLYES